MVDSEPLDCNLPQPFATFRKSVRNEKKTRRKQLWDRKKRVLQSTQMRGFFISLSFEIAITLSFVCLSIIFRILTTEFSPFHFRRSRLSLGRNVKEKNKKIVFQIQEKEDFLKSVFCSHRSFFSQSFITAMSWKPADVKCYKALLFSFKSAI